MLAVVATAVAVGCGSDDEEAGAAASSGEKAELTFALPNNRSIQYHPYYIAQELGYFDDESLDVEIEVVDGSSAVIQQVIAGNVDVGMTVASAFLQGASQGRPLSWIYSYFYRNIFGLVTPQDSGISSTEQLKGKTIGVSAMAGGEVPEIRAIMGTSGLKEGADYEIQPVGEGGALTLDALKSKKVDAYSSSVFDIASIEGAGLPLTQIMPEDFQFSPSLGEVVTAETLQSRKDELERFHRAVVKAQVFARANPDRAKEIAKKHGPELFEDEAVAEAFWETTVQSTTPPDDMKDAPIGAHHVAGWEHLIAALEEGKQDEGGIAKGSVDLSTALDDSIVEGANDFDKAAVEQEATAGGA